MKKGTIVFLAAVLLAALAVIGCSKKEAAPAAASETPSEPVTIRVMSWGSTESAEKCNLDFQKLYPEFTKKAKVEFLLGGDGDDKCAQKIRLALAANESIADVHQLNYTQIAEFATGGALEELTDLFKPVESDLIEGFKNLCYYDGTAYAMPNSPNPKLWFYRKDVFDQAGVDAEKVKNLDDFIAAYQKIKAINPKYKMWSLGPANSPYQYMMTLSGTDASFADKDGNYQLTKNPNFKKVLEVYKRLIQEGVVSTIQEWTPDWEKAWADEVYVSYLNASWLVNAQFVPKYAPAQKGKWYATTWPSLIGENGGSEAGGSIMTMPVYAQNKEIVKEYFKLRYLEKDGWFLGKPYSTATIGLMKSWLDDPRSHEPDPYVGGDYAGAYARSMETFKIFPWDPSAAMELQITNPYFDAAINGTQSIDDALKQAQADLENQIGNPWDK